MLKYDGKLWLGHSVQFQHRIFAAMHDSTLGGHSRGPATYQRIKQLFYWPNMKTDIFALVKSCSVCQQAKPDRSSCPGLLQPLPVLDSACSVISLDFVEGLPQSGSANSILVVIDKFTKFGHFIPLKHPFTAQKWLSYSWTMSIGFMACPLLLSLIEIEFSPAHFGNPCSSLLVRSSR